MAERSVELNNEIKMDIDKTNDTTAETLEDTGLTNHQTEITLPETEVKTIPASDDPDQIRENIEETRAEMSGTIDAIQEKLSFSNISDQVKAEVSDYVGETIQSAKNTVYEVLAEKGEFIMKYADKRVKEIANTDIVKTAGRNPLALGLIGLGIGLLFWSRSSKKNRSKFRYDESYEDQNENYGRKFSSKNKKSTLEAAQNKISDAAGAVGDSVSSAASAVSDRVSGAAGTVSSTVSNAAGAVSETVSDVAGKAYKKAGKLGSKAEDFAGTAQDQFLYYVEEKPLVVGAVALALGAAVGMAFPSTRIENKYMGEARNNLLHKAEESARDAVGKVQQVAGQVTETVTETVKEEAKNQGLTQ